MFPIKLGRSIDLLDRTTESPPEIPDKSRRTLMSPQECDIDQGNLIQIEIKPDSFALVPEHFHAALHI